MYLPPPLQSLGWLEVTDSMPGPPRGTNWADYCAAHPPRHAVRPSPAWGFLGWENPVCTGRLTADVDTLPLPRLRQALAHHHRLGKITGLEDSTIHLAGRRYTEQGVNPPHKGEQLCRYTRRNPPPSLTNPPSPMQVLPCWEKPLSWSLARKLQLPVNYPLHREHVSG